MSYSFSVKASNKAQAKALVAAKFAEVVQHQPVHLKDRDAVLANASAVIDLLSEDDENDIEVSCHGSLGWSGAQMPALTVAVHVSANAWYAKREAAAA